MTRSRRWLWLALGLLAMAHHDFWWWDDRTIVFGFLPVGLAYHMVFSIAAGALWWFAARLAWPAELETFANGDQTR